MFGSKSSQSAPESESEPSDSGWSESKGRRSIGGLVTALPELIARRIRGEIDLIRADITAKVKRLGKAIGLLVAAGVFGFLLLEVLITAAILGTATVFPAWLAALLVAAALLVITAALAFLGRRALQQAAPRAAKTDKADKADKTDKADQDRHRSPVSIPNPPHPEN